MVSAQARQHASLGGLSSRCVTLAPRGSDGFGCLAGMVADEGTARGKWSPGGRFGFIDRGQCILAGLDSGNAQRAAFFPSRGLELGGLVGLSGDAHKLAFYLDCRIVGKDGIII